MNCNATKCYIPSIQNKASHFYQLNNQILQQVPSNPYLGIQISKDVKWTTYINSISTKANSSFGFIRRNLPFFPEDCRRKAYVSLVRSILEHSAVVWDPHLQKDSDRPERVQHSVTHFIKQDYKTRHPGCVTAMLKALVLTPGGRKTKRLIFMYKGWVGGGVIPAAIPSDNFLVPLQNKRQIRPKKSDECKTTNVVDSSARRNTLCFAVDTN